MPLVQILFLLLFVVASSNNDNNLRYTIVLDAGSTGSRCYVYRYDVAQPLYTIMEVAHMRVNPALSSFVGNATGLALQLSSLITFAKIHVHPPSIWSTTNITLKATAGLRAIPEDHQQSLIDMVSTVLTKSGFAFDPEETGVISGEEEALYDVLAVNAALGKGGISSSGEEMWPFRLIAGDMGGSSQQIAFSLGNSDHRSIVDETETQSGVEIGQSGSVTGTVPSALRSCKADWRLTFGAHDSSSSSSSSSSSGDNNKQGKTAQVISSVDIYAKSLEFMGLIAAMDTVLLTFYSNSTIAAKTSTSMLSQTNATNNESGGDHSNTKLAEPALKTATVRKPEHPCLPSGKFPQHIELPEPWQKDVWGDVSQPLFGSGDFDECHRLVRSILVPLATQTLDLECVRQGRAHNSKTIVGMDNFPKVLEVLHLPQGIAVSPSEIRQRALVACRRPWESLLADFPGFMPYRAQRACFGAAYVYSMLTDVYGIAPDDAEAFLPGD